MTFPLEGTSMSASSFRILGSKIFLAGILLLPIFSFAQSDSKAFRSNYVVSVQDLKMESKGHAAFDKGSRLLEKGDTAGSLVYFEKAIAQAPEHYLAHYRLGHTADAEQAFQKSIDITRGGFAPPQFAMGALLCQKQQFLEAEKILQRGLDLDPGSPIGKYYLGWAQLALNRLVEADRSLQQALFRDPNFPQARTLLEMIQHRIQARQNLAEATIATAKP